MIWYRVGCLVHPAMTCRLNLHEDLPLLLPLPLPLLLLLPPLLPLPLPPLQETAAVMGDQGPPKVLDQNRPQLTAPTPEAESGTRR